MSKDNVGNSIEFSSKKVMHYSEIKYIHTPTGKVYTSNGAGGIITEGTNVPLPLWLTENSLVWYRCTTPEELNFWLDLIKPYIVTKEG